jgi:hypothetical protein
MEPRTGETARVFALRVREAGVISGEIVESVTTAYMDARYGNEDGATERLQKAVAAIP